MLEAPSPSPSSPAPRRDAVGIVLALTSAAASGTLGVWGKLAARVDLDVPTLLTWRFGLTAALLLAFGAFRVSRSERISLLLLSALYAVATALYFAALARITAGTSALLVYLAPAFVVLYAALGGERTTLRALLALACTLLGLGAVIGWPSAADRDGLGLLLGGAAGASYGAYLFASGRLASRAAPLALTAHVSLACAAVFAVLGSLGGTLSVPTLPAQWGLVLGMIVVPTLLALPTLAGAVRRIGAARVSLLVSTDPLWAIAFAALMLGERPRPSVVLGGLLILAGAISAQARSRG
ncbi:DMT family transporter [Deinococcus yavapaiensis]|uniref:Threonine/homoserine efflux transporter RhtA n=1 Tax=Deinococcus yavapaiensis KR-236 TaxID=694435 RepID=A0A318RZH6_9DEIO|nr:DMT family transporter [Deinococcus yavapaiensis]PYE49004.1 threonine/homoserine efflux transporter RhtA [Deinococcus yavapaiensis KR-236]